MVTLGEGSTPLLRAPRLSEKLGVELWLKWEGANPTGSFKDRGMTIAVSKALEDGAGAVVCASTGNTAASAAAYAARAGITAVILQPADAVARGKIVQAQAVGARVLQVQGPFEAALSAARELARRGTHALVNSLNPHRLEGPEDGRLRDRRGAERRPRRPGSSVRRRREHAGVRARVRRRRNAPLPGRRVLRPRVHDGNRDPHRRARAPGRGRGGRRALGRGDRVALRRGDPHLLARARRARGPLLRAGLRCGPGGRREAARPSPARASSASSPGTASRTRRRPRASPPRRSRSRRTRTRSRRRRREDHRPRPCDHRQPRRRVRLRRGCARPLERGGHHRRRDARSRAPRSQGFRAHRPRRRPPLRVVRPHSPRARPRLERVDHRARPGRRRAHRRPGARPGVAPLGRACGWRVTRTTSRPRSPAGPA